MEDWKDTTKDFYDRVNDAAAEMPIESQRRVQIVGALLVGYIGVTGTYFAAKGFKVAKTYLQNRM